VPRLPTDLQADEFRDQCEVTIVYLLKRSSLVPSPLPRRLQKDSSRVTVSGNSFCDSDVDEGTIHRKLNDQFAGGIVLRGLRDVAITGNTFFECAEIRRIARTEDREHPLFKQRADRLTQRSIAVTLLHRDMMEMHPVT
jgi:hypothetical protein